MSKNMGMGFQNSTSNTNMYVCQCAAINSVDKGVMYLLATKSKQGVASLILALIFYVAIYIM